MNAAVSERQEAVTRQYDEVIAENYDRDPQEVTHAALDRALRHLESAGCFDAAANSGRVFDVGMGTGLFLEKLLGRSPREFAPYGLDISQQMVSIAERRIPELQAVIEDAANLDAVFVGDVFDIVCTHFVTGFVPLTHIAPMVWNKLSPGGYWSFIGGTSEGYPGLQRKANSRLLRMAVRGGRASMSDLLTPQNVEDAAAKISSQGFEILRQETFEPQLHFGDFAEFMEFAYHGGWLTPIIETLGLHRAHPALQKLLNTFVFPMDDCHRIAIILARKPLEASAAPPGAGA